MNLSIIVILAFTFFLSLPRWLPKLIIQLRMSIFTRINGDSSIQLPTKKLSADKFLELYANPAMSGRSKGAALSDLFWYWLSPGPEIHPEHLELSDRYKHLAGLTRKVLAVSKKDIESLIDQYREDPLKLALNGERDWKVIRLRDQFMPLWSDFFYQIVFREPCSKSVNKLIVDHASDVVNALKCCKLRNMRRRSRLTNFLMTNIRQGKCPVEFPSYLSDLEKAHFLQGTFFNTGVVQMSEAMAHLVLAIAQHPQCQKQLKETPDHQFLDDVINESLRLHPLFGIAHRITSSDVDVDGETIPKDTVVCFNYPEFHKEGYKNPEKFDPSRWGTCPAKESNFIPFGVSKNRSCPAQGLAMVSMRQLTKHLVSRYHFASPVPHTRSMPNRGPCVAMQSEATANRWLFTRCVFPWMRIYDRWEGLYRSLVQLVFGTIMVVHAKKLKLCQSYFVNIKKNEKNTYQYPESQVSGENG